MMRPLALAAVMGCAAALIVDLLLQSGLAAVRLDGSGWTWLTTLALERGRWVMVAALLWLMAPLVSADSGGQSGVAGPSLPRSTALALAGRLMLAAPLAWTAATVILRVFRLTLEGAWPYEGRIFLTSEFYGSSIIGYAPWALGGLMLVVLSRHLAPDRANR